MIQEPYNMNYFLFMSAEKGDLEGVKEALDKGADPTYQADDGLCAELQESQGIFLSRQSTVLHLVASKNCLIATKLLGRNPELVNIANGEGETPIFDASSGNIESFVLKGADIRHLSRQGRTPLMKYVAYLDLNRSEALLNCCKKILNQELNLFFPQVLTSIIYDYTDYTRKLVNFKNEFGVTPLYLALITSSILNDEESRELPVVKRSLEKVESIVRFLLSEGAKVDSNCGYEDFPLIEHAKNRLIHPPVPPGIIFLLEEALKKEKIELRSIE